MDKLLLKMGEAKRKKEQGLPPKATKEKKKDNGRLNISKVFREIQILWVILALGFVVFWSLIWLGITDNKNLTLLLNDFAFCNKVESCFIDINFNADNPIIQFQFY